MKKSLVLAMAMALGVTASAYAANPFSDVPAGHWAYDSVAKLAAAGVVDGYADGAFAGDKLITRYEMAQIVAKAMAKGADCDKLAAEFADELDSLGVRVAKLEKAADAVTIAGQARFDYKKQDGADAASLRTRLWVNGQINDDWSYTGMLQNTQTFAGGDDENSFDNKGDDSISLKRAYVEGKVGGVDVMAGRWNEFFWNANILDNFVDAVRLSYGDDVKVGVMAGKMTNDGAWYNNAVEGDFYAANVATKIGAVDASANWFKVDGVDAYWSANGKKEIYNVNVAFDVAKDTRLSYEYMWGDKKYNEAVSKDGFVARVDYKGADAAAPGSYGVHAQWFDQPVNAVLTPTTDANTFQGEGGGYEGWNIGVDYTLDKNVQLCVNYYETETKDKKQSDDVLYTELYFFF